MSSIPVLVKMGALSYEDVVKINDHPLINMDIIPKRKHVPVDKVYGNSWQGTYNEMLDAMTYGFKVRKEKLEILTELGT